MDFLHFHTRNVLTAIGREFDSGFLHQHSLKRIISLRRGPTSGPLAFEAYKREK